MGSQKISEKTSAQLIAVARTKVNDANTPYFASDTEMLTWFNEGHRQASLDAACIQNTEYIDLIANQYEYEIVNRYFRLHAVVYIDANSNRKALVKGTPARIGHIHNVSEPVEYYEFDGYLGVYPALTSVTTEKVRLYQSQRQWPDIDSVDTLNTPSLLDNAIVWWIVAQHLWKDRQWAASAQAMSKYDEEVYKARLEFFPGFEE